MISTRNPVIRQPTDPLAMLPGRGDDLVNRLDEFGLVAFGGDIAKQRQGEIIWPDENQILQCNAAVSEITYSAPWWEEIEIENISHLPTPGTAQISSIFSTPACVSICRQVMRVSLAVFTYVAISTPCARAGKADPCPRRPCGGNFASATTALASSAVLTCGTTMPLAGTLVWWWWWEDM